MTTAAPLSDLRVVEIGQVLAAPFAGMILADLGAEVVKVEKPGGGDDARQMGPEYRDGASMLFHSVNRGKRSVVLDLKTDTGRERLFQLLANADLLLHNLRPGEADRMGIGAEALRERFPQLVYCELTAFGHVGPRRLQPGYEPLLQAFSGLMSTNGEPDRPAVRISASVVDEGSALWIVVGALAALHERRRTGRAGTVRASLLETALTWSSQRILGEVNEGRPSRRLGSGHNGLAPYRAFEAADGALMITVGNDRLFAKFAASLGHPEWTRDPRFATNRERLAHREALDVAISAVMQTRSRAEWEARLVEAGVPVAAVNSIAEALADPQVGALGILRPVPGGDGVLGRLPITFDGERPEPRGWGPGLDEPPAT